MLPSELAHLVERFEALEPLERAAILAKIAPEAAVPLRALPGLLGEALPAVDANRADPGLTLEEVGEELNAAVATVRKYIREGKPLKDGRVVRLRSFKGVGGRRVTRQMLNEFLVELQRPEEPDVPAPVGRSALISVEEAIAESEAAYSRRRRRSR